MSTDETAETGTSGSANTDLVVRGSDDLVALTDLERILLGGEVDDSTFRVVTDPAAAEREIIAQLLAASTDEELEGEATGWQELEGVPVRIDSFKYLPSTFKSNNPNYVANPVYFVVFGERLDLGEHVVLTTGSKGVCAQLVNLAKRGRIPGAVRMLEVGKERESGNTPLRLVSTEREKEERRAAKKEQADAANAANTPGDNDDANGAA